MKYLLLFPVLFTAILLATPTTTSGQVGPPPHDPMNDARPPDDNRPNLLAELGLSPEQVQQIRRMNQERRPAMQEAQRRMREANRNLDLAIYGETVSDADFQAKLKEFHAAQAELSRLRFESELSVRKVLTPDQLVRFREIRRRFAEERQQNERENRRMRRGGPGMPRGGQGLPLAPNGAPKRPIN
jgi:Spy/CpxP family protein refolding chaperone